MKKFTKIALVIAAIIGGIGIACLAGVIASGFTWARCVDMLEDLTIAINSMW